MRLLQAANAARQISTLLGEDKELSLDRHTLEETCMKIFKVSRPGTPGKRRPVEASTPLCCPRGSWLHPSQAPADALPEEGERPTKTSKRFTLDGWEGPRKKKSGQTPPPEDNWRGCTWSSGPHC